MIETNMMLMELIDDFIDDVDYKLKPIDRNIEPGDLFFVDEKANRIINYGSTDDIVHTDEFMRWLNENKYKYL